MAKKFVKMVQLVDFITKKKITLGSETGLLNGAHFVGYFRSKT
jgi:hypothetical protein